MKYIIKITDGAFDGTVLESAVDVDKIIFVDKRNRQYKYEQDYADGVDGYILCNFVETTDEEEFDKEINEGWKE